MRVDATGTRRTRDIGQELDFSAELLASTHVRLPLNFGVFRPGDIFGQGARTAVKFDLGVEYRFQARAFSPTKRPATLSPGRVLGKERRPC
jgi:hypothetical protein